MHNFAEGQHDRSVGNQNVVCPKVFTDTLGRCKNCNKHQKKSMSIASVCSHSPCMREPLPSQFAKPCSSQECDTPSMMRGVGH